jgi:hypothetical protein
MVNYYSSSIKGGKNMEEIKREDKGDTIYFSFGIGKDMLEELHKEVTNGVRAGLLNTIMKGVEATLIKEVLKYGQDKKE